MHAVKRQYFERHELLIMAALAAAGGLSGSAIGVLGSGLCATIPIPGGLQFLAGTHVLWLTLAIGLVRKPGAATATALLKGGVELLTGNPHGLMVLALCGLAGVLVDLVWLLSAGRDRPLTYLLAGGCSAASNVFVLKFITVLPVGCTINRGLLTAAGVAFVSGVLLAGVLVWGLLQILRRAGVAGRSVPAMRLVGRRRVWLSAGALGLAFVFCGMAMFLGARRAEAGPATPVAAPEDVSTPAISSE